nr:hypothetical protein [Rhodococcus sp. NCIMB 12038]
MTAKWPCVEISGHVVDVFAGQIRIRGGSSDSALNDWHVNPTGPVSVIEVTIVTPVMKCPRVCRKLSGEIAPEGRVPFVCAASAEGFDHSMCARTWDASSSTHPFEAAYEIMASNEVRSETDFRNHAIASQA